MKIKVTSKEVLDYIILNRRKNELEFKKNFLIVKGANSSDPHIAALNSAIQNVEETIKPLKKKMEMVGLTPIILNKDELDKLNEYINSHSVEEAVLAASSKSGELYEKMKRRGELAKKNYELKEEIAALTVILTMVSPLESKKIREVIEGKINETNVTLSEDIRNKITPILERMGYMIQQEGDSIKIKKHTQELIPRWIKNEKVWVEPTNLEEFDKNEEELNNIMKRIQYYTAKNQINELTEDEYKEFKELQEEYIKRIKKRESLCFPAYTEVEGQVEVAENQH